MNHAIDVGATQVLSAAGLVALALGVSAFLRLGLGSRLLIASLRMVVQLLAVGSLLDLIFGVDAPLPVIVMLIVMTSIAGWAALGRVEQRVPGAQIWILIAIAGSAFVSTGVVTQLALGLQPWYRPAYLIPLTGMVLGNSMTSISLGMDRLLAELLQQREVVEERLAAGASPWEAARPHVQTAVRTSMVPILNVMTVAGIVSLPGMMTGQILAGADPLQAVAYQIIVMFMICGSTALGGMSLGLLVFRSLLSAPNRIAFERITAARRRS